MAKWQIGSVAGFLLVYSLTVLLTGHPEYLLVTVLLAVVVLGYAGLNHAFRRRIEGKHGNVEDALSAEDEGIPSAHLIPDDETATGDTPEAHDEINPHDLPKDAPGRAAAEDQAAEQGGVTTGDDDPPGSGRFDRPEAEDTPPSSRRGGVAKPGA
jgi:hypothetical protein